MGIHHKTPTQLTHFSSWPPDKTLTCSTDRKQILHTLYGSRRRPWTATEYSSFWNVIIYTAQDSVSWCLYTHHSKLHFSVKYRCFGLLFSPECIYRWRQTPAHRLSGEWRLSLCIYPYNTTDDLIFTFKYPWIHGTHIFWIPIFFFVLFSNDFILRFTDPDSSGVQGFQRMIWQNFLIKQDPHQPECLSCFQDYFSSEDGPNVNQLIFCCDYISQLCHQLFTWFKSQCSFFFLLYLSTFPNLLETKLTNESCLNVSVFQRYKSVKT